MQTAPTSALIQGSVSASSVFFLRGSLRAARALKRVLFYQLFGETKLYNAPPGDVQARSKRTVLFCDFNSDPARMSPFRHEQV